MIKTVLGVIAIAIAALLIYATTQPDPFSIQRSATIAAPPQRLFALISDVKAFNTWNPFARKDPAIQLGYEGAASGVDAAYTWQSNEVGAGRMEIIEAAAPDRVAMQLAFTKPFATTNRVEFTLQPQGAMTQVTWAMTGPMPYLSKLICTFVSMEKMVGPDFEAGLANLKAAAEKG
jgi:uncharacterized protein YndB with AHSA1/START domain